jgi:hypothetical protein
MCPCNPQSQFPSCPRPAATRASIDGALRETSDGNRLLLNIAFNYAGRTELVDAVRTLHPNLQARAGLLTGQAAVTLGALAPQVGGSMLLRATFGQPLGERPYFLSVLGLGVTSSIGDTNGQVLFNFKPNWIQFLGTS